MSFRSGIIGLVLVLGATMSSPAVAGSEEPAYRNFDAAPHHYFRRTPRDRFTTAFEKLKTDPALDRSSEKAFLTSFLRILNIPVSSQMLVFSTTSLQLRFISPSNPRAVYFNEDTYIGYIPGGRMEVVALDPELGAIFYIFDIPRDAAPIRLERSDRCMNCHATDDTGYVPGLVVKSVVPAPTGGSLEAFRLLQSGHGIPFSERFGGWHVTGEHGITNHWGNIIGRYADGVIKRIPNMPGERFPLAKYPVSTSDILAHLLLEHQVGFVNRVVEASYRARTALHESDGKLTPTQAAELDDQAALIVRYLLFADEAPLPGDGLGREGAFRSDFLQGRVSDSNGRSLKDFDLRTRLFKHRCSYMIYSPIFTGLPGVMKSRIYDRLGSIIKGTNSSYEFAYLPGKERAAIHAILKETLKDLPTDW